MNDSRDLMGPRRLSVGDIAEIAGVGPSAVSNWRKRYKDFPLPADETSTGDLFESAAVVEWLEKHGKPVELQREQISDVAWRALDRFRGALRADSLTLLFLQVLVVQVLAERGEAPFRRLMRKLTSGSGSPVEDWAAALGSIQNAEPALARALELPPKLEPRDLAQLADVIEKLPLGEEDWDNVATNLLHMYQERVGARGIAITPESVVNLQVALLEPIEGAVYDPACGAATVLAEAWRRRSAGDVKLYGQEINGHAWRLSVLHAFLLGAPAEIEAGDTLRDDRFRSLRAERVAGDPPWGMKLVGSDMSSLDRWKWGVPGRSADWLWAEVVLEHLADEGRGVVTISPSALDRRSDASIRSQLIESGSLDAVIELPPGLWWGTKLPAALLVFDRQRTNRLDQVLFVDARQLGEPRRGKPHDLPDQDIRSIVNVVTNWRNGRFAEQPRFTGAATFDDISGTDFDLSPKRYIQYSTRVTTIDGEPVRSRFSRMRAEIEQQQRITFKVLGEVADTFRRIEARDGDPYDLVRIGSLLASEPKVGRRQDADGDGNEIPFVSTGAVSGGAQILRELPEEWTIAGKRIRYARRGDLLLVSRGVDLETPVGCTLVDVDGEIAYSASLLRLRPNTEKLDPLYLLAFLTSRQGRASLAAATTGNVIANLRGEAVSEIGVPLPDLTTQQNIAEAVRAVLEGQRELLSLQHDLDDTFDAFREGLVSGLHYPSDSTE